MSPGFDVVVVGGGIAGLSVLCQLAGRCRAVLLEMEPVLAAHASGRNAAIRRPLENDCTTAALAQRSGELLAELLDEDPVRHTGLLLVDSDPARQRRLQQHASEQGVEHSVCDGAELLRRQPLLRGGDARCGLFVPGGGELDIHAITSGLAGRARRGGAEIRLGTSVAAVELEAGRVAGVRLSDGARVAAAHVVLAAGAWSRALGAAVGAGLPLQPVRRHLLQIAAEQPSDPDRPVVWRLDQEVYFRPETGGYLASPCDATPWPAQAPPADPACRELLAARLGQTAPQLASAQVRSHWACLRTFAPDGELVAGPDPRMEGLHWLGGLGGRGMTVGPAAGEVVAQGLESLGHPLASALGPARLISH